MLHPFKPLISRLDGLQLAANQPGFEAFKANSPAPLWEGRGWKGAAEKPSEGQGATASRWKWWEALSTKGKSAGWKVLPLYYCERLYSEEISLLLWLISSLDNLREESPLRVLLRFGAPLGVLSKRQVIDHFMLGSRFQMGCEIASIFVCWLNWVHSAHLRFLSLSLSLYPPTPQPSPKAFGESNDYCSKSLALH